MVAQGKGEAEKSFEQTILHAVEQGWGSEPLGRYVGQDRVPRGWTELLWHPSLSHDREIPAP